MDMIKMNLEEQLNLVFERLDRIEKELTEMQNTINKINIIEFEQIQLKVKLISPIVLDTTRDKCNIKK